MACPFLFSSANLIDAIQNEPIIWDTTVNASEEEKEMAWRRISDLFGLPSGSSASISLHQYIIGLIGCDR